LPVPAPGVPSRICFHLASHRGPLRNPARSFGDARSGSNPESR
jgi:hypothetical protein